MLVAPHKKWMEIQITCRCKLALQWDTLLCQGCDLVYRMFDLKIYPHGVA